MLRAFIINLLLIAFAPSCLLFFDMLKGIPKYSSALRVQFKYIRDAAATARDTLNYGVIIGRCELMDTSMVKIIYKANYTSAGYSKSMWDESHTLMYEVSGSSISSIKEQLEIVTDFAGKNNGYDAKVAYTPDECKALWKMCKETLWFIMGAFPYRQPMIIDVCVPLSRCVSLSLLFDI
jgi:hypothetical protein